MNDRSSAPRKQTPRVPASFLYTRLVPIAIGLLVVVLIAVLVVVVASLFMPVSTY